MRNLFERLFSWYHNMNIRPEIMAAILVSSIGFCGGLMTWHLTEQSKLAYEDYKRREDRYIRLVSSLRGFYVDAENPTLRYAFLSELDLCWLYCDDRVIRAAYEFLDSVTIGKGQDEDKQKLILGKFVHAIREDLISRKVVRKTGLKSTDFRVLRVAQ